MAIIWEPTITPISIADKTASIIAVCTDDSDGSTRTYKVAKATIDTETMSNNNWIMDEILAKYQADLTKEAAVEEFITDLESAAKTYLEAND